MKLRINKQNYEVSTAFMTLIKYTSQTGKSFINSKSQTLGDLATLIYCGIKGEKPELQTFFEYCEADTLFSASAFAFQKELFKESKLRPIKKSGKQTDNIDNINEFTILALWFTAKLPFELLDMLNLAQISALIDETLRVKNGKSEEARELTNDERKAMYNITPDKERQISEYLRGNEHGE